MKSRAAASIALAAALGLGLSACNYFAPQSTTVEYAASDGVHIDAGDFQLRNLIVLAHAPIEGEAAEIAHLMGAVVNDSGTAGTIAFTFPSGSGSISMPAGETYVPLSFGEGEMVELSGSEFMPGQYLEITFTPSGGGESVAIAVPILDGTLAEYSTLVPTATPTPTMSATPTGTPTETPGDEEPAESPTGTTTGTTAP